MISDAVCKVGKFREKAGEKHALSVERTNCAPIIDYKGMFRRKTRNFYVVC